VGQTGPTTWVRLEQVRPTQSLFNYVQNVNNYCSRFACNRTVAEAVDGRSEDGGNLRWRRSCCHWPGVKLAVVLVEELVALEGVAAAHVTGAAVVGAGVANGWSCSSRCCDETVSLLLFLRMKAPRRGGCCLCYCCRGCGSREGGG